MRGGGEARATDPPRLMAWRAGRLGRGVILAAIGMTAAIAATTTGVLMNDRGAMRQDAMQRALGLADAAAATLFRATETVTALSRLSASMMRAEARGDDWARSTLEAELREHLSRPSTLAVQVAHVGPDGWTRWSNLQDVHRPVDLRDRVHIRVHLDGHTEGLFVSVPVFGRISNRWTVQFSERVEDGTGRLVGIVVVSVETESLTALLDTITRQGESIMLLRDRDGATVAATGAQQAPAAGPDAIVDVPDGANPMRAMLLTPNERFAWGRPAEALHTLPGIPLRVVAQVATESRAAFLRRNLATVTTGVTATCVVLALAALLIVGWRSTVRAVETEAAFEALESSNMRFRQLAEHVADLVMIHDTAGGLTYVSPSAHSVTGMPAATLTEAAFTAAVLGAEGPAMGKALRHAAVGRAARIGPFRFRRPDGSVVWLETILIAIEDGAGVRVIVSSTRNVTETVEARLEVQRLNEELSLLLAQSPVELYRLVLDEGTDLAAAGAEPIASLGGPGGAAPRAMALTLAMPHPGDMTVRARVRAEALAQGEAMADYRVSDGRGGWRSVRDHVRRADAADAVGAAARPALVGALADVSRERALAIGLAQASKLASLGEMATGLAHELNQPLASIGLAVENLRAALDSGEASRESVEPRLCRIEGQIERAVALVERMRVYGRIAREGDQEFSLSRLIGETVARQRSRLEESGIAIRVVVDPQADMLTGPRDAVEQVVTNLLLNAIDAVGGVAPGRKPAISITARPGCDEMTIEVDDNGPGLHPDVLPKIFDPFFTTKLDDGHQGLGLTITYGIVSDLGGLISATNTETGAKFRITLPSAGRIRVVARNAPRAG